MAQYETALAAAPAELAEPLERLLEVGEQLEADPSLKENSSFLVALGPEKAEQLLRDSQAVQDWYRRNCGPDSASSEWCEAFAKAAFDRDLSLMAIILSPNPTNILGAADAASLELYNAIVGVAPPEVAPKVQLLIDQYNNNGGRQPQEESAVADRQEAQDAITTSVQDQCGITMKSGEF